MIFDPSSGSILRAPRSNLQGVEINNTDSPVTLVSVNNNIYYADTTAGDIVVNLPEITGGNSSNFCYVIITKGGGKVTLVPFGSQEIDFDTSYSLTTKDYGVKLVASFSLSNWEVFFEYRKPARDSLDGGEIT